MVSLNLLAWMIGRQVYLNVFAGLSDMLNQIVDFPIWRSPSIFMNDAMWEYCTSEWAIFRCDKIYYCDSIIITNFVWTFISDCRLKIFPPYFGTEIS
jgi:hypothetical protein